MRVLGLIPASGCFAEITRKNVKMLGGKPLIAWTIDATNKAACAERIVVV